MQVRALPAPINWRRWVNPIVLTAFVLTLLWLRGHILNMAEGVAVIDAEAYWLADLDQLYQRAPGADGAFLYSPLIAQLYAPLTGLPYEVFHALLMAVNAGALLWMLGPVLALVALLLFAPVMLELGVGNIHLLIGASIVAGVRGNAGWYWFPLLTKITPGIVVVAYDALRGQWSRVGWALGVTGALALTSAVIAPDLWVEWYGVLTAGDRSLVGPNAEFVYVPWGVRLVASALVVGLAAWKGRPVLLPLAALLALPFVWDHSLSLLVAMWPLRSTTDSQPRLCRRAA